MTWIPSASSNRPWNIRKSCFLPSCPHQVCEYYVLGYWSTATIEVCVIWLTTKLKRRRGAVWTPKKLQLSYEIANGALVALFKPYGAVTATPLLFYCVFISTQSHGAYFVHSQSARHRMAFYKVLRDSIAKMKMPFRFWSVEGNFTASSLSFSII